MDDHKVIWSNRSLHDLDNAYELLAQKSHSTAKRLVENIIDRISQLKQIPESGPLESSLSHHRKAHRYLICGHHKIIYRIEKQAILIVRVFDTRQNPNKLR